MLLALAALTAGSAAAQERRDPADAQAKAPPVEYRSAFESYRPYAEPELASWRAVNEEVRNVGGHVGLMRGQGQEKPPTKPPAHGAHK
jgi:hypothetical protein